ncbi:hypothetical protein GCM10010191_45970 [Actinomadura vinacea]|uniref:Type VII secretion protein EccE n=1 Tax=Actinomadura vinacea TaxID=115336 RepID=A0ABN3JGN4_9ACTN
MSETGETVSPETGPATAERQEAPAPAPRHTDLRPTPPVVQAARANTAPAQALQVAQQAAEAAATAVRPKAAAERSQSAPQVAAAAAVGLPAPATPVSPRPQPPEPTGELPIVRIICWQLALVLAFTAAGRPWPPAVALAGAAVLLLALSALRVNRQWLSAVLARRVRLALRFRTHDLSTAADRPATLLSRLADGARAGSTNLGGVPAGTVSRREELVAVLRPEGDPRTLTRAVFSDALLPEPEDSVPRLGLRLVLHRGPNQQVPRAWLAVRARRDVDFASDEAVAIPLGNAVRRILRRTRRLGVTLCAVPEDELHTTLIALTHTGPGRHRLHEQWRYWHAGPITQLAMALSAHEDGPADRAAALHRLLTLEPGVALTVAVAADTAGLSGMLRIAATTPELADNAAARLAAHSKDLRIRLERLDGLHGPAVALTLPIGGELS